MPCNPDLLRQTNSKDQDRYSQREKDRCEGVYLEQVAGAVGDLLVASLTTAGKLPVQWPANGPLRLQWHSPVTGPVHIQAFPVVPRKYFRLDVVSDAGSSYDWNTGIISRYLTPSETGVVAWTTTQVNGRDQRIYLPLVVGASGTSAAAYRLTLVPPVDLSEIYFTFASTVPGEKPLRSRTPLRFGSYPADQRIDMDLPPVPKPGLYRVELIGDRKDQGSVFTPPFLVSYGP
jgi:hypothetical protein